MRLPPEPTVPRLLARRLAAEPNRRAIVLVGPQGDVSLTVEELLDGAAGYAARYRAVD